MFNKNCQIVAFEPNPLIYAKTLSRFRGNSKITIHNVGLSAEHSRKTLYVPKYRTTCFDEQASFDRHTALQWIHHNGLYQRLISLTLVELECPVTMLDDYRLSPAIIKIDVQGYEKQVLEGAWSTITRSKPILLIENDDRSSAEAVMGLANKLGYMHYRFDGKKLRRNEFGSLNTIYLVPDFERGLERIIA
jgi:FkbM family methyltransferase